MVEELFIRYYMGVSEKTENVGFPKRSIGVRLCSIIEGDALKDIQLMIFIVSGLRISRAAYFHQDKQQK